EWECPNLLELPVEGRQEKKWVLLLGINPGAPLGGSINIYYVGDFDGTSFEADETTTRVMDFGKDYYAVQTFNSAPENKAIAIGWASNWQYTQIVPTYPWRGALSIPRVLRLRRNRGSGSTLLVQKPISLENLRDKTLHEGSALLESHPLSIALQGNASLEFKATLVVRADGEEARSRFAIDLPNSAGEKVTIGYDWPTARIFVDRGQTFGFADPLFSPRFEVTCAELGDS